MHSALRRFAIRQLVTLHPNPVHVDTTGSFSIPHPTQLVLKPTPSRALRASGNTARPSIRTTASPSDGASKSACMLGALLLLRWWIGYGASMLRKVRHSDVAADDKSVTAGVRLLYAHGRVRPQPGVPTSHSSIGYASATERAAVRCGCLASQTRADTRHERLRGCGGVIAAPSA
jgi:hypothetical protein